MPSVVICTKSISVQLIFHNLPMLSNRLQMSFVFIQTHTFSNISAYKELCEA